MVNKIGISWLWLWCSINNRSFLVLLPKPRLGWSSWEGSVTRFSVFTILVNRMSPSCRNRLTYLKIYTRTVDCWVSITGKYIVPTLKLYSLKSSSCIFIRMKYRELCLVQGFINDVLSEAGCSAYLHIKQLSEETFLLLLQGINQFKASSHHLYSFQLSLLLLK